tara:strand:+ start:415 stop:642 length:228 start_codon:yes stop_codon:yes gene_type:complete
MEGLPNDIIMRIIREADGGRYTHTIKFSETLVQIERGGRMADEWFLDPDCPDVLEDDWLRVFYEACEVPGYYGCF